MRIKLDLDPEAQAALIRAAVAERRPIAWQAEILLRRALGLPDVAVECSTPEVATQSVEIKEGVTHA